MPRTDLLVVVKWAREGDFTAQNAKLYVMYGWVAVAAFIIIMITSVPWARNAFYGIFKVGNWAIVRFILKVSCS